MDFPFPPFPPFPGWCGPGHDCHEHLSRQLTRISEQLDRIDHKETKIMSAQDDINAAITVDTALLNDLTSQASAIAAAQAAFQQEITSLQGQGVDTSGLVAVNEQLTAAQQALDSSVSSLTTASQPPAP